jgi:NitT/TauT family transport system substrate-binding protein
MPMYSPDGRMPKGGPEFVLSVLQQFDENVKDKQIDLSKTYTSEFVDAAK